MNGGGVGLVSDSDGSLTDGLNSDGVRYSILITRRAKWGPLLTGDSIAMMYFQIACFLQVFKKF